MSNRNTPFSSTSYDLGGNGGVGKGDVDTSFRDSYKVSNPCIYCGNPASLRIIPKHERLNTAQIQDKGFICEGCAIAGHLNKSDYGIRNI